MSGSYYIGVSRFRRPTSCGSLLFAVLAIGAGDRTPATPEQYPGAARQDATASRAPWSSTLAWATTLPARPVGHGTADGDRIYVPLEGDRLAAIDRDTGAVRWTAMHDGLSSPVAAPGAVWITTSDGLLALDAGTGTQRHRVPLPIPASGPLSRMGDLLLVPLESGDLWALDSDARVAWRRLLRAPSRIGAAAGDDGILAVVQSGGGLVALDAGTGEVLWTRSIGGALTAPIIAGGRVLIGSNPDAFYAFHARSGRLGWVWPTGSDVVGAAAGGGAVYVASLDNVIRALDIARGHLRWKQVSTTRPVSPPLRAGTWLFVAGARPAITVYDTASNGAPHQLALPQELSRAVFAGAPIVLPGPEPSLARMVVVARDGRVVALDTELP